MAKNGVCGRELAQVGLAVMAGDPAVVVTGMPDDRGGVAEWSWQLAASCWQIGAGNRELVCGWWLDRG